MECNYTSRFLMRLPFPEGPCTQYVIFLVPKAILKMGFWARPSIFGPWTLWDCQGGRVESSFRQVRASQNPALTVPDESPKKERTRLIWAAVNRGERSASSYGHGGVPTSVVGFLLDHPQAPRLRDTQLAFEPYPELPKVLSGENVPSII